MAYHIQGYQWVGGHTISIPIHHLLAVPERVDVVPSIMDSGYDRGTGVIIAISAMGIEIVIRGVCCSCVRVHRRTLGIGLGSIPPRIVEVPEEEPRKSQLVATIVGRQTSDVINHLKKWPFGIRVNAQRAALEA